MKAVAQSTNKPLIKRMKEKWRDLIVDGILVSTS